MNTNSQCGCCRQQLDACVCSEERCRDCFSCERHCRCYQIESAPTEPKPTSAGCHPLPPRFFLQIAQVLARTRCDQWRQQPRSEHVNHALAHLVAHRVGDTNTDHLIQAVCRLPFALQAS